MPMKCKSHSQRIAESKGKIFIDNIPASPFESADETPVRLAKKAQHSKAWQDLRNNFIRKNPLCYNPFGAHDDLTPGMEVHHIIPISLAPQLLMDTKNLAVLCRRCHKTADMLELRGLDTRGFFNG